MALSPNYNWSEPDNSSLVKDGAQAMRTLGDAIDASLWSSGYGQAGKNKIINGDFSVWQRGTSLTGSGVYFYTADRWETYAWGTNTVSQQTFTPGAAPVAGYEGKNFLRISSNSTNTFIAQKIEDVRTFAGQTVTLSFWAKTAATNTTTTVEAVQVFGSGGSSVVATGVISSGQITITTSWQRFSKTFTVPSIAGKTIGSNSYLTMDFRTNVFNQNFDLWGVQLEQGSIATPFQTASGGSVQNELAMCQRYYEINYPVANSPGSVVAATGNPNDFGAYTIQVPVGGVAGSSRSRTNAVPYKVTKRIAPTIRFWDMNGNLSKYTAADSNGSFISNNNSLDTFGGAGPYNAQTIIIQTVAASASHTYCGFFWEASAEL